MAEGEEGFKIYIGNVIDTTEDELRAVFEKHGEVTKVFLARKPSGFAFLWYREEPSAATAVDDLDGATVCGNVVKVAHARPENGPRKKYAEPYRDGLKRTPPVETVGGFRVKVENVAAGIDWRELKDTFRAAGEVCYTNVEQEDGKTVGIAEFSSEEARARAIEMFDDTKIGTERVRVTRTAGSSAGKLSMKARAQLRAPPTSSNNRNPPQRRGYNPPPRDSRRYNYEDDERRYREEQYDRRATAPYDDRRRYTMPPPRRGGHYDEEIDEYYRARRRDYYYEDEEPRRPPRRDYYDEPPPRRYEDERPRGRYEGEDERPRGRYEDEDPPPARRGRYEDEGDLTRRGAAPRRDRSYERAPARYQMEEDDRSRSPPRGSVSPRRYAPQPRGGDRRPPPRYEPRYEDEEDPRYDEEDRKPKRRDDDEKDRKPPQRGTRDDDRR